MKVFRGATAVEIIAVRLDAGDDIADCLGRVAGDLQLAAGVVLAGSGTLARIALETPATETWPPAVYPTEKSGPGQILAAQGLVAAETVQVGVTVARRGELFGGTVIPGCRVLHAAEFVILRAGGARWGYAPSAATGVPLLEVALPPGAEAITLLGRPVDAGAVALVPAALIRRHQALPVARTGDTLVVAMADPNNPFALDDFRAATRLRIQAVAVPPAELLGAIERATGGK